jgi:hypothetical protein
MPKEPDEQKDIKEKVRALILAGYHVDQISEALGFSSVEEVRTILDELFADEDLETLDDKRSLDNQRLEEMMAQFWYRASRKVEVSFDEQYRAATIYLRLMRQRARLLGLDKKNPKGQAQKDKYEKYTVTWNAFEPLKKDAKNKQ